MSVIINSINNEINDVVLTGTISVNASTGTDGQVLVAATGANPQWATLTAGAGISLTPGANSLTITNTGGSGGFTWAAAPADASLVNGHGAINTKAALLTMTLPATAAVGTIVAIQGSAVGVAGWEIAQNAGQNIWLQGTSTTIGVTGYIASTLASDGVTLLCTVADTTWNSIAVGGNITVF